MARGEMSLVTHPEKAPAVDFFTRSSEGPFVDTGLDVTFRSQPGNPVKIERIYISIATVRQLMQVAGLGGSDEAFTTEREANLIARGKLEGLNEGLADDFRDVARTISRWLDDAGVSGPRPDGA